MKTLTLTFILPLIFLMLCAFGGAARGEELTPDMVKLIKRHAVKDGHYIYNVPRHEMAQSDNKELIYGAIDARESEFMDKVARIRKVGDEKLKQRIADAKRK